jgi:8-oxo-dGTP diphosphatase
VHFGDRCKSFGVVRATGDNNMLSNMKPLRQKLDRPIMAMGGIVVKASRVPLIAVVQRRKDGGWVLPKGKKKRRESELAAARREAEKETGHDVVVHEFLGTTSYESGGKTKIIQFWLMASVGHAREEADDDKAVKWLPLNAAIASLSEPLERAFLAHVGRQVLSKTRTRLRRDKSPNGRNFTAKLRSAGKLCTPPNERKGSKPSANARIGTRLPEERSFRARSRPQSLAEPNFIRRFLERLRIPGHAPNQSAGN